LTPPLSLENPAGSRPRRALFIATYSHSSPYKLGSHHICDELLRRGWQVTLITHPLGLTTLMGSRSEKLNRLRNAYRSTEGRDGQYKEFSRLQAFVPVNRRGFAALGLNRPGNVGWPSLRSIVRDRFGTGSIDLLYMDNVHQPFWLDYVTASKFVLRLPDDPFGHGPLRPPLRRSLMTLVRRADATICPSAATADKARCVGARSVLRISNGVDLAAFRYPRPPPEEYAQLQGPIAIYLGACDQRVDKGLLQSVAQRTPEISYVVVGDVRGGRLDSSPPANLHILGARPYADVPDYLINADVGLLPFDAKQDNLLVQSTDPLKLYQYLAAGLPVVSTDVPAARSLAEHVTLAPPEPDSFSQAIRAQLDAARGPRCPDWLAPHDWRVKVDELLEQLDLR